MIRLSGITLALIGIAHFIAPQYFKALTKPAFPENTDDWIMRNGAIETAVGTAIACQKTRKLGSLGLGVYGGWLAYNSAKNA